LDRLYEEYMEKEMANKGGDDHGHEGNSMAMEALKNIMENLGKEFPDAATANLEDVKNYILDRLTEMPEIRDMVAEKLN
jgi:alkylhydroperoxidase/carboxymuconolactone decarboxylase family protein YurZ